MGLIINKSIPMFIVGYPTVSDKYNVTGGTLTGTKPVQFGQLVKFSGTKGYFEALSGGEAITDIAGFVLATNVKLAQDWPGTTVQVNPGEAFNLVLPNSYLAIKLAANAVEGDIAANKAVAVLTASGLLTTSGVAMSNDLPNVVFTGMYERHGNTIVAEIYVK